MNTRTTILLFVFLTGYSSALRCFECDPRSKENCLSPDKSNTDVATCPETIQTTDPNAMLMTQWINQLNNNFTVPKCYYLHFNIGNLSEAGVYRGCVKCEQNVVDFCESLNKIVTDGQVKYCHFCKTDECNDRKYDPEHPDGFVPKKVTERKLFDTKRNSADETKLSELVLFVNFIICLHIVDF